jgi:redox-sensitive bicupin YhaK (pirin superfamily)
MGLKTELLTSCEPRCPCSGGRWLARRWLARRRLARQQLVHSAICAVQAATTIRRLSSAAAAAFGAAAASYSTTSTAAATMFNSRQIASKFVAREQGEGAGARVHRSIGTSRLRNLDPFLMLDEFNVGLPGGFPDHPHRGFETVTYVLPTSKGHMCHEDFLGNKGELRPGDLQWMTPGRGIMHAEMPLTEETCHGLQLWINLPKARKIMEPRYQEIKRETVPHAFNEDKSVEAILFAGEVFGKTGPIETEAPVTYIHFKLQPGAKLEYAVPQGHNTFVYAVSGTGKCVGHSIQPHEAIVMENEGDGVLLTAADNDALEVIIMTGEPLNEPVVQYGPFVMTTTDEIRQTFMDFQLSKNGFENAATWASEIGNRRR